MVGMRVKAESYQGIELSTNLREVSQCLEKAPKIAKYKEKVLIIETPCTANKTMTPSQLMMLSAGLVHCWKAFPYITQTAGLLSIYLVKPGYHL